MLGHWTYEEIMSTSMAMRFWASVGMSSKNVLLDEKKAYMRCPAAYVHIAPHVHKR